jgi:hypothetical protein
MPNRPESRTLQTTDEVMRALGGPAAVSSLTGARYKTVWPWSDGKTFPARYFLVMTWALKKKRLSAPPSLWGQVTTPAMQQAAA